MFRDLAKKNEAFLSKLSAVTFNIPGCILIFLNDSLFKYENRKKTKTFNPKSDRTYFYKMTIIFVLENSQESILT